MTQEQKAKAYDDAIEKAKGIMKGECKTTFVYSPTLFSYLFPELAENEDEKIRDEIIAYIGSKQDIDLNTNNKWRSYLEKQCCDKIVEKSKTEKQRVILTETDGNANIVWDTRSLDDAETLLECGLEYVKKLKATTPYKDANKEYWRGYREGKQEVLDKYAELEKQDEHTDKVESKFHEGDWVAYNSQNAVSPICQITKVDGDIIDLKGLQGERFHTEYWDLNENYHLWTIDDAKDGDVLVDEDINVIGIFEGIEGMCWHSKFYYSNFTKEFYGIECGGSHQKEFAKPATKEQRDLLFSKMKESWL